MTHGNLGKKRTIEQRVKLSISHKNSKKQHNHFKKGNIPWNIGKKVPKELNPLTGRKLPITQKNSFRDNHPNFNKENHPNWKGGITPINFQIRNSKEYQLWRRCILERDNYTCIWCGYKGNKLTVDHIKPFSLYPELRFAIDNGRTLCTNCHKTTETYAGRATKWKEE